MNCWHVPRNKIRLWQQQMNPLSSRLMERWCSFICAQALCLSNKGFVDDDECYEFFKSTCRENSHCWLMACAWSAGITHCCNTRWDIALCIQHICSTVIQLNIYDERANQFTGLQPSWWSPLPFRRLQLLQPNPSLWCFYSELALQGRL